MKKIILTLLLIFPTFLSAQNQSGHYRANFFNLFSEPKMITAEFEVKTDNSLIATVKIGDEVKNFVGLVDKKGKFEAKSQIENGVIYILKGKFDKENKISFVRRIENKSSGSKSVSENGLEGRFVKVEQTKVVENPQTTQKNETPLVDNGKSWLEITPSASPFGTYWENFTGNIAYQDLPDGRYLELTVKTEVENIKQSLRILISSVSEQQKVWKISEISVASYREENTNSDHRNFYISSANTFQTHQNLATGLIEIVKQTETQTVFKISNLRIKRLGKEDFITINGFIYV